MSQSLPKWKKRLKMILSMPFSNHALKFFPPDFTLRDPVLSLLYRYYRKGHSCGLILLHLEQYHHMMTTYPSAMVESHQAQMKRIIKEKAPQILSNYKVIGTKEYPNGDLCIFVTGTTEINYNELHDKGKELSKEIRKRLHEEQPIKAEFDMGCYVMEAGYTDVKTAVYSAYYYAQAIATRKLPKNFLASKQKLSEILHTEDIAVLAQPIINLQNGEVFGWELLTRGPQNTPFHLPMELFEMAYQADLLSKLEILVMKKAFAEIVKRNIKEQVFINVTAVSLNHPLFLDQLLHELQEYPSISSTQIIFEITERHAIRDYLHMSAIMRNYREKGFRFAIDDAGAGYASLQTISELIPDIIKIDKSVIQNIDQVSVKQSMLQALMLFARNINCQVVAEGIEREEEANILFANSVQMGQGYYFAKPEPYMVDFESLHYPRMKEKVMNHLKTCSA